jgi:hypothetical protein
MPGNEIKPVIKLNGLTGVTFIQKNSPQQFTLKKRARQFDIKRAAITPESFTSIYLFNSTEGETNNPAKVLLTWKLPADTNYLGVQIFRSEKRPLGDFSHVGERIYEGYGCTNSLLYDPYKTTQVVRSALSKEFDAFISPPFKLAVQYKAPVVTNIIIRIGARELMSPPRDLVIHYPRNFNVQPYFIDLPPESKKEYTYTLYSFNRAGIVSYPLVINAILGDAGRCYHVYEF